MNQALLEEMLPHFTERVDCKAHIMMIFVSMANISFTRLYL